MKKSENRIPVTARGGDVRIYPEKSNETWRKAITALNKFYSETWRASKHANLHYSNPESKIFFTGFECFLPFKGLYIIFVNQLLIIFFFHNFVSRIKHLIVLRTTKWPSSPIHPIIKTCCLYLFEKNTKKMSSPSDGACCKRCLHSENIFTALPGWSWTSHLGSRTRHKGNRWNLRHEQQILPCNFRLLLWTIFHGLVLQAKKTNNGV